MPTPAISVLMPVYNAERYVAEAVESILAQTFADFEFIIIDDGSTDRSLAILQTYAARDRRIRLINRPNTGYVVALNEMLQLARGELLARMDADDVSMPDRFERQIDFLRAHTDIVCVGGEVMTIDASGRDLLPGHLAMDHDEIQELALSGRCALSHPTVMMRATAVHEVGGYRSDFSPAEDLDLWLRLGERGRLKNLPGVVLRYRHHDQSVSARQQFRQLDQSRAAAEEARTRRGLPAQGVARPSPWRPTDRKSRSETFIRYGWMGFMRGDRRMAWEYGVKAVWLVPWRSGGWRLLLCLVIKRQSHHLKNPPPADAGAAMVEREDGTP